jgi:hypothetical protein
MSTSWMAPLGGLPGLGAAVLAGVVAVLALICYCRAAAVPALPPRREVLEFSAGQLAGATAPAEVRTILAALEALGQGRPGRPAGRAGRGLWLPAPPVPAAR